MIKRARKQHLEQINSLLSYYGSAALPREAINDRDLCLIAVDQDRVVGCVWCGVMAGGTMGYVGAFVAAPDYAGQGIGRALLARLVDVAKKREVRVIGAHLEKSQYLEKTAKLSLDLGCRADAQDSVAIRYEVA